MRIAAIVAAASLSLLLFAACGGGDDDATNDASVSVDADPNAPDADPNAPDADPNAPDANPGVADANPSAPDADPNAPDADPSAPDAATGCTGGLTLCNGSCVDVSTDNDYCGNCVTSCTAQGKTCVLGGCAAGVGALVLSEVHAQHPSYFELYNGGSAAIDIKDYLIQWNSDNVGSGSVILPTYSLAPGSFVVLREGTGTDGDGLINLGTDIGWLSAVAVRLLDPSGVGLDFVRTGNSTFDPPTGTTWSGTNAKNPGATVDQSLVRNVYAPDTNTAADWTLTAVSSPGDYCAIPGRCGDACFDFSGDPDNCGACGITCSGSQLCVDADCVSGRSTPWISEYRRFPRPMVELHNPTVSPVVMTGYRLDISGSNNKSFTFPAGFTLQPGAFVAVYMGTGEDDAGSLFVGSSKAFAANAAIALYDDGSTALDFVRFGTSTEPAPSSAPWFGTQIPAVSDASNQAARRDLEKLDTDSAADWKVGEPATPGIACFAGLSQCSGTCKDLQINPASCGDCTTACSANESCVAGICKSSGKVLISELRNSGVEAFELFNGTAAAVDLEGWRIEWTADNVDSYTIGAGVSIPPGGFLLFIEGGGSTTPPNIRMGKTISWTDFVAVTLSDTSAEVDFVRTGTSVTTGTWSGDNAPNPTASLHRRLYETDTDTNADWYEGAITSGRMCAAGESVCGAACMDLDTDPNHCGTCGNTCGPGSMCYQGGCVADGAVRLGKGVASDGTFIGRPEMFVGGRWRTVYNTTSTANRGLMAEVACRQLGFATGVSPSSSRYTGCAECGYRRNVNCAGTEARLADCPYSTQGTAEWGGLRIECRDN